MFKPMAVLRTACNKVIVILLVPVMENLSENFYPGALKRYVWFSLYHHPTPQLRFEVKESIPSSHNLFN